MPVVNVEEIGRIEFPDNMSPAEIAAAIKNEIVPAFRQRLALAAAGDPAKNASTAPSPFSKGTAVADGRFRVGDRYEYRISDLLTKLETRQRIERVTEISDDEVSYNGGRMTTDFLGNYIVDDHGRTLSESQYFVSEYSVGRKWSTRVFLTRAGSGGGGGGRGKRGIARTRSETDEVELDFKVVGRENITVPAGTFDAFKVEGQGFVRGTGTNWKYVYWIAPEKVRRFVAMEHTNRNKGGRIVLADRYELAAFRQAV